MMDAYPHVFPLYFPDEYYHRISGRADDGRVPRERDSAGGAQLDEAGGSSHHIRPGRDGLSLGVTRAACCAAQQHVQHHSPRRAAPRYWIAPGPWPWPPGGVKREVAIAPVIRPRCAELPWFGLHSPPPISAARSCAKPQVAGIRRGGVLVPCNRACSFFAALALARVRSRAVACGRLRSPAAVACGLRSRPRESPEN